MVPQLKISYGDGMGGKQTRNFGNCCNKYLAQIGTDSATPTPDDVIQKVVLPYATNGTRRYQSFWEWADVVARAINGLSLNVFRDAYVVAEWSTTSELNND